MALMGDGPQCFIALVSVTPRNYVPVTMEISSTKSFEMKIHQSVSQ